ncbi:hypothetical protein SMICM17S_05945 [Streptomyces microflavus]
MIRTVLDGFRDRVPADWTVAYAPGARILDVGPDPEGEFFPDGQPRPEVVPAAPDPGADRRGGRRRRGRRPRGRRRR